MIKKYEPDSKEHLTTRRNCIVKTKPKQRGGERSSVQIEKKSSEKKIYFTNFLNIFDTSCYITVQDLC